MTFQNQNSNWFLGVEIQNGPQEIQNGPMWNGKKVNLDGDHGAMGSNHNEVLSHGLSQSRNVGSEEGIAEQLVPLKSGGSSGQPQERQPRLEVAKTAERRHVNEARKPVKQEGDTRSCEANLRSEKPSAVQIGKLMPKFFSAGGRFGKICWIIPADSPDTDWWLRLLVNKVQGIRKSNAFVSINNEPFKFLKQAELYEHEIRFKFTSEEYSVN